MKDTNRIRLADFALIGVALLWGAGFIAVQYALKAGMSSSLIVALRFIVGTITVFVVGPKTIFGINKHELLVGIGAGVLLYLSFLVQTLGQAYSGVSNAAFITAIYVVLVPFIIWLFKGYPPKVKMFFLVFSTLLGVFVLTYQKGNSIISFNLGDVLLMLCALGFAGHISYLGLMAKHINPVKITFLQLATAAVLGSVVFVSTKVNTLAHISWTTGGIAIVYLGIISSALCFFLQTWAQTITTPSKAAIMMSMESLFGALFSILIGFEVFKINIPIGGVIILASVVLSEIDLKRKMDKPLNN